MYSKDEASQLKQAFWTAFGKYMLSVHSAEGMKTNWINYKTGIKHVSFRMQADNNSAFIGIVLTHPDEEIQELFYEQFLELKNILRGYLNEDWDWQLHTKDEYGKTISYISKEITGVSIYNKSDWPELISFFKPRIIALDEFWSDAKYAFDALK